MCQAPYIQYLICFSDTVYGYFPHFTDKESMVQRFKQFVRTHSFGQAEKTPSKADSKPCVPVSLPL